MVCQFLLYNKVNQLYIDIYPHIPSLQYLPPILPIPPLQVVTKHRADLPVLYGCFPLAIYFTFGSVYMSMSLSHFVSAYPSSFLCPQVHSLHLRLYSCPVPRFFRTIKKMLTILKNCTGKYKQVTNHLLFQHWNMTILLFLHSFYYTQVQSCF